MSLRAVTGTSFFTIRVGYLREIIEPVSAEIYATFEGDAQLRLRGRDDDDWPVLASALALACGVWTEDADFFGTGIVVWTTNRIEIFLHEQAKRVKSQEE